MSLRPAGRAEPRDRGIKPLAIRLVLYTAVPLLAIASPLLVLPVVSLRFGPDAWASIAVGQSVGSAVAVVVELGWGLTGPLRVATADMAATSKIFRSSYRQRFAVASVFFLPLSLGMYWFADGYELAVVLSALSALTIGLGANWLYVGKSRPQMVIFFDSVPRILGAVLGAVCLYHGTALEALPAIQLVVSLAVSIVPFFWLPRPATEREQLRILQHLRILWSDQGSVLVTTVATTVNQYLPVVMVYGLTGSVHVAQYASADRLQKIAVAAVAPFTQVLQGWMPAADESEEKRRIKAGIATSWVAGLLAGVVFIIVTPYLVAVLFVGTVTVPPAIYVPLGMSVTMVVISRCTGNIALVLLGSGWITARSALVGAAVSLLGLVVTVNLYGVYGVCWTVFLVESIIVVIQTLALRARLAESSVRRQPA